MSSHVGPGFSLPPPNRERQQADVGPGFSLPLGPIPLDEVLPLARQIPEALDYAYMHGIVHRDLKQANVKVTEEGMIKILDFDLAKDDDAIRLR